MFFCRRGVLPFETCFSWNGKWEIGKIEIKAIPQFPGFLVSQLLFIHLLDIFLQRHCHGRSSLFRRVDIEAEASFFHCFRGGGAKCGDAGFVLLELREVLEQRGDARRGEENENIVIHIGQVAQVAADGTVEHGFGVIDLVLIEDLRNIFFVNVGARVKEFILFVLADNFDEIVEGGFTVEDLALTVLHVFLEVISGGFGDAEIFHRVRNGYAHFGTDAEKVINGVAAGKNDRIEFVDVHTLLAKVLRRHTLYVNEFTEVNFKAVLLRQIGVRRFVRLRFRLSDQDAFDLRVSILRCCQLT
jgi:hypothetical protein